MGVSRDTFYRYQELVNDGGIDDLINQNRRVPNVKNRVDCSGQLKLATTLLRPTPIAITASVNIKNTTQSFHRIKHS